jgi:hypothetical protein
MQHDLLRKKNLAFVSILDISNHIKKCLIEKSFFGGESSYNTAIYSLFVSFIARMDICLKEVQLKGILAKKNLLHQFLRVVWLIQKVLVIREIFFQTGINNFLGGR